MVTAIFVRGSATVCHSVARALRRCSVKFNAALVLHKPTALTRYAAAIFVPAKLVKLLNGF